MKRALSSFLLGVVVVACGDSGSPSDTDSGTVRDPIALPCPATRPPALARIRAPGLKAMCIDSTEVTVSQYAAFVSDPAAHGGKRSSFCPADTSDRPDPACLADPSVCKGPSCGDHPQVCVTICSARAYCAWAGKVLCGANEWSEATNTESARWGWGNACGSGVAPSGLAAQGFPYGQERRPNTCNDFEKKLGTTTPVGSLQSCQSPTYGYGGVFDLSGNAAEWVEYGTDERSGHVAGGSFSGTSSSSVGDCFASLTTRLSIELPDVGFRCCLPTAE